MPSPPHSPSLAGHPGRSTTAGPVSVVPPRGEPPSNVVTKFDHIEAYEALQEARAAVRQLYSDKNIEHTDAHEEQIAARARLNKAREKPKRYRKVWIGERPYYQAPTVEEEVETWMESSVHAAPGELEEMFGDSRQDDEADGEDGVQGSWWGHDISNDGPKDAGREWGQGGPNDPSTSTALETRNMHTDLDGLGEDSANHQILASRDDEEPKSSKQGQWEWETASSASSINSLFDETLCTAKESHALAKKTATAIWEEMRGIKTQELRYNRMLADLQKQYPELRGYVDPHASKKRKAPANEDFEAEPNMPSAKRVCRPIPNANDIRKGVDSWHQKVVRDLKNHAKLERFPEPEFWDCVEHEACWVTQPKSGNVKERKLWACAHNIGDACEDLTKRQLKKYITAFHPDRFSACREDRREEWQGMASEVFVVLNEMWVEKFGT